MKKISIPQSNANMVKKFLKSSRFNFLKESELTSPIPKILFDGKSTFLTFPWLLSTSKKRFKPTFWNTFKQKLVFAFTMNRIQKKHLKKPHFDFPTHFYDDVEEIIEKLFQHDLSNISNCTSMVKCLQNIFNKEYIDLRKRELTVDFKFENLQKKPEFDIQITEISFIYGPHPIPPNYVVQNWPIHKLIIPQSDKVGKNHQHQEQIFRNAMNEGCCIKIYTRVTFKQNLQFIVKDGAGKILIEDYRNNFDIQFCTPNFKPTDNIYEMTSPKKKHLKFDWKISDIDYLIYGTILESSASDTFNNYT